MQRRFRLRAGGDFDRLRREGQAYRHRQMTLTVVRNGLSYNRYGFITGKRLGKAVQRNRARRLLREAVRGLHPHLRSGHDVVLIAREPLNGQPFAVVERVVRDLFDRAGLVESEV